MPVSPELQDGQWHVGEWLVIWACVGMVTGNKAVNPRAFSNVMTGLWNPQKGMELVHLNGPLFLLTLHGHKDMLAILKGEPWSFDKRLILMTQVSGDEQLSTTPITHCSFWVKLHDIPYRLRTQNFITEVAGRLGSFISTDEKGVLGWGSFIRVRVVINVTLPLKKEVISQERLVMVMDLDHIDLLLKASSHMQRQLKGKNVVDSGIVLILQQSIEANLLVPPLPIANLGARVPTAQFINLGDSSGCSTITT
ncbi:hypothetical protein Tsubulata_027378 [Turnera subulata]|uniref:DUF4283 domain-containing protein n=1 Tax=Turnera subulata TaxID=218843 RepID=A0A9Q0JGR3_9ROSI|nr:hypothetical protein Tsubulata_027378 [Turnera subulata]